MLLKLYIYRYIYYKQNKYKTPRDNELLKKHNNKTYIESVIYIYIYKTIA